MLPSVKTQVVLLYHAMHKNRIHFDSYVDEFEYESTNHRQYILLKNNSISSTAYDSE
jgi:hypothetical protein